MLALGPGVPASDTAVELALLPLLAPALLYLAKISARFLRLSAIIISGSISSSIIIADGSEDGCGSRADVFEDGLGGDC